MANKACGQWHPWGTCPDCAVWHTYDDPIWEFVYVCCCLDGKHHNEYTIGPYDIADFLNERRVEPIWREEKTTEESSDMTSSHQKH